jgi:ferritin-like metal-binding protein YciE
MEWDQRLLKRIQNYVCATQDTVRKEEIIERMAQGNRKEKKRKIIQGGHQVMEVVGEM